MGRSTNVLCTDYVPVVSWHLTFTIPWNGHRDIMEGYGDIQLVNEVRSEPEGTKEFS